MDVPLTKYKNLSAMPLLDDGVDNQQLGSRCGEVDVAKSVFYEVYPRILKLLVDKVFMCDGRVDEFKSTSFLDKAIQIDTHISGIHFGRGDSDVGEMDVELFKDIKNVDHLLHVSVGFCVVPFGSYHRYGTVVFDIALQDPNKSFVCTVGTRQFTSNDIVSYEKDTDLLLVKMERLSATSIKQFCDNIMHVFYDELSKAHAVGKAMESVFKQIYGEGEGKKTTLEPNPRRMKLRTRELRKPNVRKQPQPVIPPRTKLMGNKMIKGKGKDKEVRQNGIVFIFILLFYSVMILILNYIYTVFGDDSEEDDAFEPKPRYRPKTKTKSKTTPKKKSKQKKIPNCGSCKTCLQMKEFGGPGTAHQACMKKKKRTTTKKRKKKKPHGDQSDSPSASDSAVHCKKKRKIIETVMVKDDDDDEDETPIRFVVGDILVIDNDTAHSGSKVQVLELPGKAGEKYKFQHLVSKINFWAPIKGFRMATAISVEKVSIPISESMSVKTTTVPESSPVEMNLSDEDEDKTKTDINDTTNDTTTEIVQKTPEIPEVIPPPPPPPPPQRPVHVEQTPKPKATTVDEEDRDEEENEEDRDEEEDEEDTEDNDDADDKKDVLDNDDKTVVLESDPVNIKIAKEPEFMKNLSEEQKISMKLYIETRRKS